MSVGSCHLRGLSSFELSHKVRTERTCITREDLLVNIVFVSI